MEEVGLLHLIFDPSKRHLLPDLSVCAACKQKILRKVNVFVHDGKAYHSKCAKCSRCDRKIAGPEGFVDEVETGLICLKCLRDINKEPCWRCRNQIGEMMVVYGGHHYHPKCFTCTRCQTDFIKDGQYCLKDGTAYCKICYQQLFLHRCGACHDVIQPGKSLIEIKKICFHPQCFNCKRCKENLMADGYFEGNSKDDALDFYCLRCGHALNLGKSNKQKNTPPNDDDDNEKTETKKDGENGKNKKVKTDDVSKDVAAREEDEEIAGGGGGGGGGGGDGGGGVGRGSGDDEAVGGGGDVSV